MPGVILRGEETRLIDANKPVAVIDIGSNSVRLVVFDGLYRVPTPIFNEKIVCGLGRELDKTNKLFPDGIVLARKSLRRFVALIDAMGVGQIIAVATAAVREAEDGPAFAREIQQMCGFKVQIADGEEEARLSAHGVLSAIPDGEGLVGDLGGASVELVHIANKGILSLATLPLGPIRMAQDVVDDKTMAHQVIDKQLAQIHWFKNASKKSIYAVGGAWRALSLIHMNHIQYPLHVAHQYKIAAPKAIEFSRFVAGLSRETLFKMKGLSKRRAETLPYAAILLERLLEETEAKNVIFSAYGLREGCIFDRLAKAVRTEDPLVSHCRRIAENTGRITSDGRILFEWMSAAFPGESDEQSRLRRAACFLSDLEWSEHPDYRVEHALLRILRYPLAGVDHAGRAYMGLSVASRHGRVPDNLLHRYVEPLLSDDEMARARATGLAMRLAYTFSGGVISLIEQTSLRRSGNDLYLEIPSDAAILVGDVVQKRFNALSKLLGCTPHILSVPDLKASRA